MIATYPRFMASQPCFFSGFYLERIMLYLLPNILTFSRIIFVPLVVACLYSNEVAWRLLAAGIFILASVTDFLDGWLARRLNAHSKLGQMLDPIADKLLIAAIIVMLTADGTIADLNLIAAIMILCREILVSGLREYLAGIDLPIPVSWLAKYKTAVQMIAIIVLIVGNIGEVFSPFFIPIGLAFLWLATALTVITGYQYVRLGIIHLSS